MATVTWARSPADETLLARSIGALARLGHPVAVADRGNSPAFTRRLQTIPGVRVIVPTATGLVAQVQASVALARRFELPWVLYTEPDKESFFDDGLARFMEEGRATSASVVIASRSCASFESYPATQQYTEGVFNRVCGEMLNVSGDYCYGPFLMTREVSEATSRFAPALNWGWRPATFRIAHQRAGGLLHLVDDYPCPPEQRVEDAHERAHRIRQLSENLRGLLGNR